MPKHSLFARLYYRTSSRLAECRGNAPLIVILALMLCVWPIKRATAQSTPVSTQEAENAAWESAVKEGTATAFFDFYRRFPSSSHIKTATATLRARYWFETKLPFENSSTPRSDGVVVTVEGMHVSSNLSLDEAKRLKVITVGPPTNAPASGSTFNYKYVEVTKGGIVVGQQTLEPRDSVNSTIILSADGTRLLTWDLSKATPAPQPSSQPTIIEGPDGKYICGPACSPSENTGGETYVVMPRDIECLIQGLSFNAVSDGNGHVKTEGSVKSVVCKLPSGSPKAIPLASHSFHNNTLVTNGFGDFRAEIPDTTSPRTLLKLRQDKVDALREFLKN